MLGEDIYKAYLAISALKDPDWLKKIRETGSTHLVVRVGSPLDYGASYEALNKIHADKSHVLYEVR